MKILALWLFAVGLLFAQYTPPNSPGATGPAGPAGPSGSAASSAISPWLCVPASASGTAYVCTPTLIDGTALSSATPVNGQQLIFFPDVSNTGGITIQVDGVNARSARAFPATNFSSGDLTAGVPYMFTYRSSTNRWISDTLLYGFGASLGIINAGNSTSLNLQLTTTVPNPPIVRAAGRSTAQIAAVASLTAFTVGASDSSFTVSANVNVTASATHSFSVTVTYTDETNTSRVLTLSFSQLTGTFLTAITNVQGTGAYEGIPLHIRCKAATSITIATTGTFTSVTYNVEGFITQIG